MDMCCSQVITQTSADVDAIEARLCVSTDVGETWITWTQFFPCVMELQLLDGCFEGGTRVRAGGITCSKHAIEIAGQNDMRGSVAEIVGKRLIEEMFSSCALRRTGGSVNVTDSRVLHSQRQQSAVQTSLDVSGLDVFLQSNSCPSPRVVHIEVNDVARQG